MSEPKREPFPEWRSKHITRVTLRPMILAWVKDAQEKGEVERISGLALGINMLDEAEELFEMYAAIRSEAGERGDRTSARVRTVHAHSARRSGMRHLAKASQAVRWHLSRVRKSGVWVEEGR